jgi:ABC-type nitrate/sulfonate/bicarbonate transport system permease component
MLGVVVLGVVGYAINRLAGAIGARFAPWRRA